MGKDHTGHTMTQKMDLSEKRGEEVLVWLREHKLVEPCHHEDHAPEDGAIIPTKLGAEAWMFLSGMVSTEMLQDVMAFRIAEAAGWV